MVDRFHERGLKPLGLMARDDSPSSMGWQGRDCGAEECEPGQVGTLDPQFQRSPNDCGLFLIGPEDALSPWSRLGATVRHLLFNSQM
jgi:hypothetical protein